MQLVVLQAMTRVKVTRERLLQIRREGEGILIYAKWPRGQSVIKCP